MLQKVNQLNPDGHFDRHLTVVSLSYGYCNTCQVSCLTMHSIQFIYRQSSTSLKQSNHFICHQMLLKRLCYKNVFITVQSRKNSITETTHTPTHLPGGHWAVASD